MEIRFRTPSASYCILDVFAISSGRMAFYREKTGRVPEHNKNTTRRTCYKTETPPFKKKSKIIFTEALYTLCNFTFIQPHFCHVSRVFDKTIYSGWFQVQ